MTANAPAWGSERTLSRASRSRREKDYAAKLEELFAEKRYKNLDLVSFTDHNCINIEAYKSFLSAQYLHEALDVVASTF